MGCAGAGADAGVKSIMIREKSCAFVLFYPSWLSDSLGLFVSILTPIWFLHPLGSSLLPCSAQTSTFPKSASAKTSISPKLLAVLGPFLLSK